jgi:hypothetical protein
LRSKDAGFDLGPGHHFIIKGRFLGSLMQIIKGYREPLVFDQITMAVPLNILEKIHFIETYNLHLMLTSDAVESMCTEL